MKGAHGEPWSHYDDGDEIDVDGTPEVVTYVYGYDAENAVVALCPQSAGGDAQAARIAACVTACDGIEDPSATLTTVRCVLALVSECMPDPDFKDTTPAQRSAVHEVRQLLTLLTPKD